MRLETAAQFKSLRLRARTADEFLALSSWCQQQVCWHRSRAESSKAEQAGLHDDLVSYWTELADLYQSAAESLRYVKIQVAR